MPLDTKWYLFELNNTDRVRCFSPSFSKTLWGEAKILLSHLASNMFSLHFDLDNYLKPVEKLKPIQNALNNISDQIS